MARGTCPNCGADLPPRAKACPECGSDEKTGWSEEAESSGLDLPDENFNYDEFIDQEFSTGPKPRNIALVWWVVALMLVVLFLFAWLL